MPTLHERIAAHPGMTHSAWVARHPGASLREINSMRKRFERVGQTMLCDLNAQRHLEKHSRYAIPGEPAYADPELAAEACGD